MGWEDGYAAREQARVQPDSRYAKHMLGILLFIMGESYKDVSCAPGNRNSAVLICDVRSVVCSTSRTATLLAMSRCHIAPAGPSVSTA
jgi:hypothetical protein